MPLKIQKQHSPTILRHLFLLFLASRDLSCLVHQGLGDELSPGTIEDFPWLELDGRTIVDCGGGQGSLALLLAPK